MPKPDIIVYRLLVDEFTTQIGSFLSICLVPQALIHYLYYTEKIVCPITSNCNSRVYPLSVSTFYISFVKFTGEPVILYFSHMHIIMFNISSSRTLRNSTFIGQAVLKLLINCSITIRWEIQILQ